MIFLLLDSTRHVSPCWHHQGFLQERAKNTQPSALANQFQASELIENPNLKYSKTKNKRKATFFKATEPASPECLEATPSVAPSKNGKNHYTRICDDVRSVNNQKEIGKIKTGTNRKEPTTAATQKMNGTLEQTARALSRT